MSDKPGSAVVVVCTTVLALGVLVLYGWQSARGVDTSQTWTLVLVLIGASVPGVAGYLRSGQIHQTVEAVKEQTNGTTTRLIDEVAKLTALLAMCNPPNPGDAPERPPSPPE